mgnify:CR=1 FL=1|jgi:predicted ATPase
MDKLRLINYRCFDDTGDIELRPITLLLGANSSGKSSFIKFFPLLQQSVGTTVNGLFLWDGQYVDFKDFKNTVKDGNGEITIEYTIDKMPVSYIFRRNDSVINDVRISMTLASKDVFYDYLKQIVISYDKVNIKYDFVIDGRCKITANGICSDEFNDESIQVDFDNNLLPTIGFEYMTKNYGLLGSTSVSAAREIMKFRGEKNINSPSRLFNVDIERIPIENWDTIYDQFKNQKELSTKKELERITNIQFYQISGRILRAVNDYFNSLAGKFSYVLPLRSIMNRYYRFQNRAVDQIDPDGDNLAMYLNSLPKPKLEAFSKWLKELFHFSIDLKPSEGHVEMLVQEEGRTKRNLVDVGFGYTQILPILTIIWKSIYGSDRPRSRRRSMEPIFIAIEQPELHLHPKFQSYFVDMLARVIYDCHRKGYKFSIIIETHSEIIVNKLGELIGSEESSLTSSDVNVVLFDAKREGLPNYVHTTTYDENGYLENWPLGFFDEDDVY